MQIYCERCGRVIKQHPGQFIFFIRHGQTDLNKQSRTIGSIDVPLNSRGREQARALASTIKHNLPKIHAILTSPLARARETAEIIGRTLHKRPIIDVRLRERTAGILEGKPERKNSYKRLLQPSYNPRDAEPSANFEHRIRDFLATIKKLSSRKNVLVVTHGLTLLTAVKILKRWSVAQLLKYSLPNIGGIIAFGVTHHKFDKKVILC